MKITGFWNWVY